MAFDGQATTWESSPVGSQYTHGNGEAMLVSEHGADTTYLFFIQGKLWKLFKTVPRSESGANFHRFSRTLRGRFGAGHVHTVGDAKRWIEFGSKRTRVRGLDGGDRAAAYGVVLEDRTALARLSSMRIATIEPIAIADAPPARAQATTASHHEAIAAARAAKALDGGPVSRPKTRTAVTAKTRIKPSVRSAHDLPAVHGALDSIASLDDDDPLTGL